MLHFEYSSIIDAPVEEVFAFHERPEALSLLIPPDQPVRVVERTGGPGLAVGSRVVLRHTRSGLRWIALHTEYQKNRLFVDTQASGPFRHWEHRHIFAEAGAGGEESGERCRLTDSIDFSIFPWKPIDSALGWLVRRELRKMFQYRHEVTARECRKKREAHIRP